MGQITLKRIAAAIVAVLLLVSPTTALARGRSGERSRSSATRTEHSRSHRTHDAYPTTDRSRGHARRDPILRAAPRLTRRPPRGVERAMTALGQVRRRGWF